MLTATEDKYLDLVFEAGQAMTDCNWTEFRRLLPTVVSMTTDLPVKPDMEQQKRETVRYFRSLAAMTDAELEAAAVKS